MTGIKVPFAKCLLRWIGAHLDDRYSSYYFYNPSSFSKKCYRSLDYSTAKMFVEPSFNISQNISALESQEFSLSYEIIEVKMFDGG